MAHIERINWTDRVPDAVAKIWKGTSAAVCIMDLMKYSEEIGPFEYLKVIGPLCCWTALGYMDQNVRVIFKDRSRTEPCKNARSAACTPVTCLPKHCWGSNKAVQKWRKVQNNRRYRIILSWERLSWRLRPNNRLIYIDDHRGTQ
jgi:hypothetical protein